RDGHSDGDRLGPVDAEVALRLSDDAQPARIGRPFGDDDRARLDGVAGLIRDSERGFALTRSIEHDTVRGRRDREAGHDQSWPIAWTSVTASAITDDRRVSSARTRVPRAPR